MSGGQRPTYETQTTTTRGGETRRSAWGETLVFLILSSPGAPAASWEFGHPLAAALVVRYFMKKDVSLELW